MRFVRLAFATALVAITACGEVAAPTNDAATDAPVDAVDAMIIDTPTDAQLTVSKTGTGTGIIGSSPGGIACGSTCSARFGLGSSVTLTASPDLGSTLTAWGGACASAGSATTCTITITADTTVTADFGPSQHTVTIATTGAGSGAIRSTPAGLDCGQNGPGGTCSATFAFGTVLTLTPTAAPGSIFAGWSGGTCTGVGACVFTVTGDTTVGADFALDNFTLIVTRAGAGTGTVTSLPAGINCGATCTANYAANTMVTLSQTPAAGSTFAGWSGACTGTGTCTVLMSTSRMVTASYTVQQFPLTVTRAGTGTGTVTSLPAGINCGGTCAANYDFNTMVTLSQTPAAGSTFAGWSGACTGTGTCTVTMSAARAVTATFNIQQFTLTVTRAGTGTGTVTSLPSGINCGATCSAAYNAGTVVQLTPAPASGSTFAGWSGACTGTGTCNVTMNAAQNATATFNSSSVVVTVARTGPLSGGATITSAPTGMTCTASTCTGTFAVGTALTLSQAPGGSIFSGWSGSGCSGTGNCSFTVTAAVTVTAAYRAINVAISVGPSSCLRTPGNSGDLLRQRLGARGHNAAFVDAAGLDTVAEINAYDVIVFGGPGDGCAMIDVGTYDGLVDTYVRTTGRGIVASGWFLYNNVPAPNANANLPTVQNMTFQTGTFTVTPVAGHPITTGVGTFSSGQWVPTAGGPKPGATSLLTVNGVSGGAAWSSGNGRAVFLGPMFLENHAPYENENLLDGSQAAPIELILRAIEWSAKAR